MWPAALRWRPAACAACEHVLAHAVRQHRIASHQLRERAAHSLPCLPHSLAAALAFPTATGKEEAQLRRLLNENEEVARQRDSLRKRLELMERAAREIMNFRV